uniref:B30.2/SPRY domain-containing protein n=1 Tax=Pelodiscus sinensis TaxID=13735 RepID=K7FPG1_PELSI
MKEPQAPSMFLTSPFPVVTQKQTQAKRQKIVAQFQQLRQFLEEQERLLLAQLEKLDNEIVNLQTEAVRKLSTQISCLSEWIDELEGKCQKPASEFLQDVKSTLRRCEKGRFQQPEKISPEVENKLCDFSQKTVALMKTLRKFKDMLPSALKRARGKYLGAFRQATVTLDPDTAHPLLGVSWENTRQPLPSNPERFDSELCVLGREGLTLGQHFWEVEVGGGERWAVGVARESVRRKGLIRRSPEGEIWAVQRLWGQLWALTSPATRLSLPRIPRRIQVCLDWDQGQVIFIDVANEALIFTFAPGSLPRERIRPWLWVGWESQLSLRP